jgi:DNA-binding XRE family transcriptional regulator
MLINELRENLGKLSPDVQAAMLALSVLIGRIGTLSKSDRDELFKLLQEWHKADTHEDRDSIRRAMEEILAQEPITVKPMILTSKPEMSRGLSQWTTHVGKTIRSLRKERQLTQVQLAELAGLPQSHISRLENAEHSPTHLTLEKIAKALDVEVGAIDPCHD